MDTTILKCPTCDSINPIAFDLVDIPRVRSDDSPLNGLIETLLQCHVCDLIFTHQSAKWKETCSEIYKTYRPHQVGNGSSPTLFSISDRSVSRNVRIIESLKNTLKFGEVSNWVDYGCGSGDFLRTLNEKYSHLELYGIEYDKESIRNLLHQQGIKGIESAHNLARIGSKNVVSLIHVLEHLEEPRQVLAKIASEIMEDSGLILIVVPNVALNQFALCIYDHSLHFCESTIVKMVTQSGFELVFLDTKSIEGEIIVLARKNSQTSKLIYPMENTRDNYSGGHSKSLRELAKTLSIEKERLKTITRDGSEFGLFGTGISATWASAVIGIEKIQFFVDEDPNRIGSMMQNRPVIHPNNVPSGSQVIACLADYKREKLKIRASSWPFELS